jgi:hypothetical protein
MKDALTGREVRSYWGQIVKNWAEVRRIIELRRRVASKLRVNR